MPSKNCGKDPAKETGKRAGFALRNSSQLATVCVAQLRLQQPACLASIELNDEAKYRKGGGYVFV